MAEPTNFLGWDNSIVPTTGTPGHRISEREMRAITRKLVYGERLSEWERSVLAMDDARRGMQSDRAAEAGLGVMSEMTGVPSMFRGAENVGRAYDEGDWKRGALGLGEIAVGALPGAGMVGRAITTPRALGTMGLATVAGLPTQVEEAQAQSRSKISETINSDPEVRRLRAERDVLMSQLSAENQRHARSGPITHETAVAPLRERLAATEQKIVAAEQQAATAATESLPFRDRHPGTAQTLAAGGLLAAGVIGAGKGFGAAGSQSRLGRKINEATVKADETFRTGTTAEAASAENLLRNRVSQWDRDHGAVATGITGAGNALKGGMIGFEASALPEQVDYVSFGPGHDARERAGAEFRRGGYYTERVMPAILGASTATLGYVGGKGVRGAIGTYPDMSAARTAISRTDDPSAFSRITAFVSGGEARTPFENSIDRINRARQAAGPATPAIGGIQPPGGQGGAGAGAAAGQQINYNNGPHGPPPPPATPAYVAYDPAVHGVSSRAALDDLLTQNQGNSRALLGQGDLAETLARRAEARSIFDNHPRVAPGHYNDRAMQTAEAMRLTDGLLRQRHSTLTAPELRDYVLRMISGRPGQLAVPIAAGAGASQYGFPDSGEPVNYLRF